jgi:hypothetical protein
MSGAPAADLHDDAFCNAGMSQVARSCAAQVVEEQAGDKMARDQVTILFRQVQSTKATKAHELLEKRAKQCAEEASRAGR